MRNDFEQTTASSNTYRTITGRHLDLGSLTREERVLLAAVLDRYESAPKWNEFSSWWSEQFDKASLSRESKVHALCEDLEARLGIAQGDFDLPDYRDYLEDLIEERHGFQAQFCKKKGVDPAYLSRLLNGGSGLRVENLEKMLDTLDAVLVVVRKEDLTEDSKVDQAVASLRSALKSGP